MGWIRIHMDPDPELGKFRAGSGFEINHFGSTTLIIIIIYCYIIIILLQFQFD